MPLLSVILPTFNSELYVAQAISSVLRQTFCDFELIIVDDHSTDLTPKIIGSFTDDRIQILRHDRNDGLVKSLNDGVALASGEYIARMDHDDIADPRRFETQIDYLKQHPDVGVLGTGIQIMNGQGELGLAYEFPLAHSQIEWAMAFFCPIAHPTVIMRAAIFNEVGGYSQEASYAEDYDLWERLIRLTKFANIPGQFLHLRKHEQNMTKTWEGAHAQASTLVAQRHINVVLGEKVEIELVRCLRSAGRVDNNLIADAADLILDLLAKAKNQFPKEFISEVERDAALRITMLALYAKKQSTRAKLLYRSHRISPLASVNLAIRLLRRKSGIGQMRLVG